MIVFALRMVEATAIAGDRAMWIMRFMCPTFNICNTIMYGGCRFILNKQRGEIRYNLEQKEHWEKAWLPNDIEVRNWWFPQAILGDWIAMLTIGVTYWILFVKCENMSWNKVEQYLEGSWVSNLFVHKYPKPHLSLALDSDV